LELVGVFFDADFAEVAEGAEDGRHAGGGGEEFRVERWVKGWNRGGWRGNREEVEMGGGR